MTTRSRTLIALVVLLALGLGLALFAAARTGPAEVNRLAGLLDLHDGMTVGEIGAGNGWLAVEVARRVGPTGRVLATELNPARLGDIREAARDAGLASVTAILAGERETSLPSGCCDAVFMRRVYHHLSDAPAVTASIHDALKPGGRLVIIDFRPDGIIGRVTGMGIDQATLVANVTAAGFTPVVTGEWPGWGHYVAVFERPPVATPD
jgi:ubiquinone/menaquinone biosynthesis C-methylase UbiE